MSNYREGANDRINEIMCALRCLCVYYTKSRYDISARNKRRFYQIFDCISIIHDHYFNKFMNALVFCVNAIV